jgi:hypothetical protein
MPPGLAHRDRRGQYRAVTEGFAFSPAMAGSIRRWRLLPALLALGLAACNSEWTRNHERTTAAATMRPANYRADITAFMRTYLNDPTRIRDAAVSEPELKTFDGINRYVVCVRYNARRSSGQYAGVKDSLVLFIDGRLDRIVDNARETCKEAAYQPFPELERLTR